MTVSNISMSVLYWPSHAYQKEQHNVHWIEAKNVGCCSGRSCAAGPAKRFAFACACWGRHASDLQRRAWASPAAVEQQSRHKGVAGAVIIASEWSCRSSPDGAQEEGGGEGDGLGDGPDRGLDGDPEGVWSPDIEQSFQEALAIYPPCGRRKIILSDEGKMYGRNELIARYIKLRTGKTRTRKQVSSHIQVLARKRVREYQASIKVSSHLQVLAKRKSREIHSKLKDQVSKDKALQTVANLSSAQIVSASVMKSQASFPPPVRFWPGHVPGQPGHSQDIKPFAQPPYTTLAAPVPAPVSYEPLPPPRPAAIAAPVWKDRTISSAKLRLLEYSAFMETQKDREMYKHLFVHIGPSNPSYSDPVLESIDVRQIYDKFSEKKGGLKELYEKGPHNAFFLVKFWADLNSDLEEGSSAFYGVSSQYSGTENITISVSTKVCSFGKQVVEKVETEYAHTEGGKFVFRIHRSPMCEYMINFIHKLKHLPEKYMMNSVLENFTILQVVSNRETQETLLCFAFVFEVSTSEHGAQYHVYRLVND
ncbi:transcriptional enhancer factor TEF-5 isoform X2 [Phyllopteryx taeniolatus]|uniref:transcriptional enhancer factor TEF-5 isoform X2 n=1 Tax=Phyllopteryx taeniolatus TaxID=161469 RepID=UPI002AD2600B|nr:transcriptional enhancer factor TEF-5 isoform X2 [Phyllopteryx taeniolatus]